MNIGQLIDGVSNVDLFGWLIVLGLVAGLCLAIMRGGR